MTNDVSVQIHDLGQASSKSRRSQDPIKTHQDIADVLRRAFSGEAEQALVEQLRNAGYPQVELYATLEDRIVGYLLISAMELRFPGYTSPAGALAPVAVDPSQQRRGIGSALIRAALDMVDAARCPVLVVLGHADYYPRFGFRADLAQDLASPFPGPSFMALELRAGAIPPGQPGRVAYPAAFGLGADWSLSDAAPVGLG